MKGISTLKNTNFTAIIEQGEGGYYIASVPALPGCHTQAKDLNALQRNIKEAVSLYLEAMASLHQKIEIPQFVGIQNIELAC